MRFLVFLFLLLAPLAGRAAAIVHRRPGPIEYHGREWAAVGASKDEVHDYLS